MPVGSALRIHNQTNQRGAMFNRKKERIRKSTSVGVPSEAIDVLKEFLAAHATDPTGPTWSLGRFISQAIHEKILRETEEYVVPAEVRPVLKREDRDSEGNPLDCDSEGYPLGLSKGRGSNPVEGGSE